MHLPPMVALLAWIPIGALIFRFYPIRIAVLADFLIGWSVLPGADYVAANGPFPWWILPVSLPGSHFLTKAICLGCSAIAGVVLFHARELRQIRIAGGDVPVLLWCAAPICASFVNALSFWKSLAATAYLLGAWAVPYLLGRHFFRDRQALLLAARAIVLAGLLYIPVCLVEIFAGPQLYFHLYGYQPFRWVGAHRYVGFRPIGFLEDGNQLGIWMASATLVAVALWAQRETPRIARIPIRWVALSLVAVTVMCQSAGAIVLLAVLLPLALFGRRHSLRTGMAVLLGAAMLFIALQFAHLIPWHELAQSNPIARDIANRLRSAGRGSFGWRLGRDESQMSIALRDPLFGSGEWNWWRAGGIRPWDLWTLVFGMYGLAGVIPLAWILIGPIMRTVWVSARNASTPFGDVSVALAGLLAMTALDSMLNAAIILPYLIVAGVLSPGRSVLPAGSSQPPDSGIRQRRAVVLRAEPVRSAGPKSGQSRHQAT